MSFFKKMLSSVGIGSAKIDTVLEGETFSPGQEVQGTVKISGGSTDQEIAGLVFAVKSQYPTIMTVMAPADEDDDQPGQSTMEEKEEEVIKTIVLLSFSLSEDFTIQAGEEKEISLSFQLPWETPVSHGDIKTWIDTGLEIKKGLDSGDKDYLTITPTPLAEAVISAMNGLGFTLEEVECEKASGNLQAAMPIVQEFDFKATSGEFAGRLEEVECIFFPKEESLELCLIVDRKLGPFKSLKEAFGVQDEVQGKLTITGDSLANIETLLREHIEGVL